MGRRGPLPKSRAQRALAGNPGKRPSPAIADLHSGDTPGSHRDGPAPLGDPPDGLEGEALAEWRRIVPLLERVVTELDRAAVELYCIAVGEAAELAGVIRTEGRTYTSNAGLVLPRPEVRILETARRTSQRLATELGLTPASRVRLGLPVGPPPVPGPGSRFFE